MANEKKPNPESTGGYPFDPETGLDFPADLAAGDHFAGMPITAHNGQSGRTGTPCSFCDSPDHEFVNCPLAALAGGTATFDEPRRSLSEILVDEINQTTGKAVIDEIIGEIESGNAHLMTRNELAEFIDWWINLGTDDNANEVIYDEMNNGNASVARHQKIAKEFFVHKGYEK